MLSRRTLLKTLSLTPLARATAARAWPLRPSVLDGGARESLRTLAARRGVVFGSAAGSYQLGDSEFAAVLGREAGILVPEYELKRNLIEPSPGHYDFSGCETLVKFARNFGMGVRGHTLVWHASNPAWLPDAVQSRRDSSLMTDYIGTVMARFKNNIHSWDVVNEAIAPGDGRKDGLRNSFWLEAFGPAFIDDAFHAARAADPVAQLVYNDWGCEAGAPDNDRFRAATLSFLEQALARGVPIDALGLQGHLAAFGAKVDQTKLARFLDDVKAIGLRILVTEHDVDDTGGPSAADERDRAVADASRRFLDVVLANRATVAVLSWGLSDRFLHSPGLRQRLSGYSPRMLPLDAELNRKPMWHALAQSFAQA